MLRAEYFYINLLFAKNSFPQYLQLRNQCRTGCFATAVPRTRGMCHSTGATSLVWFYTNHHQS